MLIRFLKTQLDMQKTNCYSLGDETNEFDRICFADPSCLFLGQYKLTACKALGGRFYLFDIQPIASKTDLIPYQRLSVFFSLLSLLEILL